MQALLIFLSTWDVVSAAAAIMNLRGGGKRIAKSLPAEADGAVHITPAVKAAAAPPTVAINTLVFMLGFLFSGRPRHSAAAGCASRIVGFQGESRRRHVGPNLRNTLHSLRDRKSVV